MLTEAQKRATAKYRKNKMKQVIVLFSPADYDLHAWVKSQPESMSGYLKRLIREDMEKHS